MQPHSPKPRILVFASGTKDGGGSGFQEMVESTRTNPPILNAEIVGVVSNHFRGGVRKKAKKLDIPFMSWPSYFGAGMYQYCVDFFKADYVMCSGWLKLVRRLDSHTTINIHPGPLPEFGGKGMYGMNVHRAVMAAYHKGEIKQSAVTMHFVDEEYDRGPVFFRYPVLIHEDDTPESLAKRVNEVERAWQSYMVNLVVHGFIFLAREPKGKVVFMDNNPKRLFFNE